MSCVEVASTGAPFEHSNSFVIFDREIAKEAYKTDLVIDLVKCKRLRSKDAITIADCVTLNSGLDDMVASGRLASLVTISTSR